LNESELGKGAVRVRPEGSWEKRDTYSNILSFRGGGMCLCGRYYFLAGQLLFQGKKEKEDCDGSLLLCIIREKKGLPSFLTKAGTEPYSKRRCNFQEKGRAYIYFICCRSGKGRGKVLSKSSPQKKKKEAAQKKEGAAEDFYSQEKTDKKRLAHILSYSLGGWGGVSQIQPRAEEAV